MFSCQLLIALHHVISYHICNLDKRINIIKYLQDFRHVRRCPANLSGASKDSLAGQSVGSLNNVAENHHFSEGTSKKLASSDCSNVLDSEDDDDDDDDDDDENGESKYDDDR